VCAATEREKRVVERQRAQPQKNFQLVEELAFLELHAGVAEQRAEGQDLEDIRMNTPNLLEGLSNFASWIQSKDFA